MSESWRQRARIAFAARILIAASAVFAASAPLAAPPAHAQSGFGDLFSAAIRVNEDIITRYDLQQRSRLISFASGGREEEAQRRAERELIEDALKLQEADRLGLSVSDEEFQGALATIVRNNRLPSIDQLYATLTEAGVERETFDRQLRVDILWNQILRRRFGVRMRPDDSEVDAAMEVAREEGPLVYDVRQIVIPVGPDAPQAQVRRAAAEIERVRPQLTSCEALMSLAPNYPPRSGKVGDLTAEQMPGGIRELVLALEPGQVTQEPIRTANGIHAIMLCGRTRSGGGTREQVTARLTQERVDRFSDSFISDLERAALIERL